VFDVAVGGRGEGVEDGATVGISADVDAVEHDRVKVDVETEAGVEALGDGDRAAPRVVEADTACAQTVVGEDRVGEDA
jgi:hypothetical protein